MRRASMVLALLALHLFAGRVSAQEATPGPSGTIDGMPIVLPRGLPVTPDPSECAVQAPTIDALLARLGATPLPGTAAPGAPAADLDEPSVATPETFVLPTDELAGNETVQSITATMRQVVACLNTGNYLMLFAFTSDAFLHRAQTEEPLTEEDVAFLRATPEVLLPEHLVSLVAVREVTVLPDGRVGALVDTVFPSETDAIQTDYVIFIEQDDRWLIDEIVEDLEGQYPPPPVATPAA